MPKVFQVQAKDSIVALNAFPTVNAVQNLNLDPTFNEENLSELGNSAFSATSRSPETAGTFEVNATCSIPSVLARMVFNHTTQAYTYGDPNTTGNVYTIIETDLENAIFDVVNLKQPGLTFDQSTVVPFAQLTGLSMRVDAAGLATKPDDALVEFHSLRKNSARIEVELDRAGRLALEQLGLELRVVDRCKDVVAHFDRGDARLLGAIAPSDRNVECFLGRWRRR